MRTMDQLNADKARATSAVYAEYRSRLREANEMMSDAGRDLDDKLAKISADWREAIDQLEKK